MNHAVSPSPKTRHTGKQGPEPMEFTCTLLKQDRVPKDRKKVCVSIRLAIPSISQRSTLSFRHVTLDQPFLCPAFWSNETKDQTILEKLQDNP
ncbi:hypothetical protein LY76DRAFT_215990 [Colletotrichum caudatum]|nr:hypothetical protein LY76DRAFT_215990 [Colletotrichum caudatum]